MRQASFLLLLIFLSLPSPAPSCSLCGSVGSRISIVQEFENAPIVIYGYLANPKLDLQPGGFPGKGTTEFHCEKIVKNQADVPKLKMILLSRYLPILDAKHPPHYLMFFQAPKTTLEPYTGRQINSPAILDFLAEYERQRSNPDKALLFAAKYFDHADPAVAEEAFLLFARANDQRIGSLAKQLAPERLRKLLESADLEPERRSMFAFLLGACGNAGDADFLRALLKAPAEGNHKSYEGILAGYITLRPQEGWTFALDALQNEKNSLLLRYAVLRTLRFFHNANAAQDGPKILQGLALALQQADIADAAIHDLSAWKQWDHTKLVLACYDKASHQSPIVKNSIVRYALACPLPEARKLVERVRREDPELVRDFEEQMLLDAKK